MNDFRIMKMKHQIHDRLPIFQFRKNLHWSLKLEQMGNRGWRYYPNRIVK